MKLNPDLVRDILLTVEEKTGYNTCMHFPAEDFPLLQKYKTDEVKYHILQCGKSDLIEAEEMLDDSFQISDLTPAGHEFLANMRNDNFFSKVKGICKELGLSSLKDYSRIASNCAAMLIKSYFEIS